MQIVIRTVRVTSMEYLSMVLGTVVYNTECIGISCQGRCKISYNHCTQLMGSKCPGYEDLPEEGMGVNAHAFCCSAQYVRIKGIVSIDTEHLLSSHKERCSDLHCSSAYPSAAAQEICSRL